MDKETINQHLKSQPVTLIIDGQSGSGKDTQKQMWKKYLQEINPSRAVVDIDTGEKIRNWTPTLPTWQREKKEAIKRAGLLQSYRTSAFIWTRELYDRLREGDEHLLIDGSPRTPDEAKLLIETLTQEFDRNPIIIHLRVSDETALSRIIKRNEKLYDLGKPVRPETETEEAIRNKLHFYHTDVIPALQSIDRKYFIVKNFGRLPEFDLQDVSISGELLPEEVFEMTLKAVAFTIWARTFTCKKEIVSSSVVV
jgi:adenylate kinase family enzyme